MKLGIALSGGGIRGIAHAGVLQALEDNNIKPDIIGGTSCGSMIGVMYAMGYSPYHIYILFKRYSRLISKANTIPIISGIGSLISKKKLSISGFSDGKKLEEIYDILGQKRNINNITNIKMPIVIPTVDIISGKEIIFTNYLPKQPNNNKIYINNINIGKAVRASSSFPAYFSPCRHEKFAFMDGGALNNVPVDEVKLQGADRVIAVKFRADEIDKNSNIMDIIMKSIDIMGSKISENSLKLSNYTLDVYTDKTGLLDIQKLDKCYEYGYKAVIDNLNSIKKILKN